jgi:hypothetical protein
MPFQVTQRTIKDMINDGKVDIPAHQRPYIWTPKQAAGFLITIMDGMPTLSLIIYEEVVSGKIVRWLEDGQQRFMTTKKFFSGEFGDSVKWNNKTFADLSVDERTRFENYPLTITTMEDVPYERRVALFQAIQDGTPLTNGQRFHAYSHSELVVFARHIMSSSECNSTWGDPMKLKDPKKKHLANAVAIASGVAFQNIDAITTSYDLMGKNGFLELPVNVDQAHARLQKLLSVYKRADELCPTTNAKKKTQWDAGRYTGYILYSMCIPDRNWEADKEMFAQFIARVRRDKLAMKILTHKKPATRNWNSGRWKIGLDNLDNQSEVEKQLGFSSDESDEEYDDE